MDFAVELTLSVKLGSGSSPAWLDASESSAMGGR
jgi:hypothetical protein